MKKWLIISAVILDVFLCHASCYAALFDRGSGLIYDDAQNLTWLQDANYAHTSGYDVALYGYDTNGGLTHDDAMKWADTLVYLDPRNGVVYDDWRLPKLFKAEGGWNDESEMGKLYYVGLNNVAMDLYPNMGPFFNVQSGGYRESDEVEGSTIVDWEFTFKGTSGVFVVSGYQSTGDMRVPEVSAWAVRDGDVVSSVVPEPATMLLFGLGGVTMLFVRKKKQRI